MKKHSWNRVTFFKSICKKCGCEKEQNAESYPPAYSYLLDGKTTTHAPICDERFIPKGCKDPELFTEMMLTKH